MTVPLSVILVNYRSGEQLRASLAALEPQLPEGSDVVVVDNDPTFEDLGWIDAIVPGARVIRNARNVGYGRANNQALAAAPGDRILLLNPDAVLEPGSLGTAMRFLDEHPDVGVLGARVLLPNGHLDPACRRAFKTPATYLYKFTGLTRLFPRHPRFGRYYLGHLVEDAVADVDSTVGAFMLIPRKVLERVGTFDERFFMYCEDEDLCWRVKRAGWRVVYQPQVVVHHWKGTSTRQRRMRMVYQFHRSLFLYHRKNVAPRYPGFVNVLVYAGILAGLAAGTVAAATRNIVTLARAPSGRARA